VDLPQDDLGVDVDNRFATTVVPLKSRGRSQVEYLATKLEGADEVYLATDPDREGEAIAADILEHCVPGGVSVQRIEFNAIVYHAVKEALDHPRAIDQNRVQAQRTRRSLDRLIGFTLSSMAKFDPTGPQLPAAGRVIAPATALVVDREKERESFIPRRFWTIHAALECGGKDLAATIDGEWEGFEEARKTIEELMSMGEMQVASCTENPDNRLNPPPPYTTDTLQNDADRLLGFSPEQTMKIAQLLYQGVEIDGKLHAMITYMRTDSTRVSPTAMGLAKKVISGRADLGEAFYKGRPWKPTGGAQDAHEAIRPTMPEDPAYSPEQLEGQLPMGLFKLYRLIYFRFLASQMVPAVYHTTKLQLSAKHLKAESEGHRLKSEGFLKLYRNIQPEYGWEETNIPFVEEGTALPIERAWPEPHETKPPPRFREGSLVSELKKKGIGRPSTYSTTLKKIKEYRYVQKTGSTQRPTARGKKLCEYLKRKYDQVVSYEYTAKMEEGLSEIEKGSASYEDMLTKEFQWLREPYKIASDNGWLQNELPSAEQINLLCNLADQLEVDLPERVFDSKSETSRWIDDLTRRQQSQPTRFELSPIETVEVRGIECYRIRLYYTASLEDNERDFLRGKGMRYHAPTDGKPPCYQFQRQSSEEVDDLKKILEDRYTL
jgi:DNA topoisomerase-1